MKSFKFITKELAISISSFLSKCGILDEKNLRGKYDAKKRKRNLVSSNEVEK